MVCGRRKGEGKKCIETKKVREGVGRESKAGEREYGGRENEAGVTRAAFRCLVGDCHYCPFRNSQSWLE